MSEKHPPMKILGVPVEFPYENIYPSQRALIANSIRAFQNQENALLESPTGTGKTLALLSSSLAYQQYLVDNNMAFMPYLPSSQNSNVKTSLNSKEIIRSNDSFSIFSHSTAEIDISEPQSDPLQYQSRRTRIWYTSRTHSQLKQLISEYKKVPYNPSMVVLASRRKLCLNKKVLKSNDINGECRKAIDKHKCEYLMKSGIPREFRSGGQYEKFDIEDMLEYGRSHLRCPYHMSLVILSKADLVFCPYNYILDPKIKGLLDLSLLNSIVIIDEAHNVENVCRESGTFKLTREHFSITAISLKQMKSTLTPDSPEFTSMLEITDLFQRIEMWFIGRINGLKFIKQKEQIENVSTLLKEIELSSINWPKYELSMATILRQKPTSTNEDQKPKFELPLLALSLLEDLFIFFVLVFKNNKENINDFQIALIPGDKEQSDVMLITCLSPKVIFQCISREVHSVICTSGTLSPLSTFSSELGTKFSIQVSANHVVSNDQISSFIITNALDGTPFNSAYQSLLQNQNNVIIGLGKLFLTLLPTIPGGVLLFLPSYHFLQNMISLWKSNHMFEQLKQIKKIYIEERSGVERIYADYQKQIDTNEAAFLIGVCRGNMSEGMDFSDNQARAVFVFGIPYAFQDVEVRLKLAYNDRVLDNFSSSQIDSSQETKIQTNKNVIPISGSEWYESQAFRSLFQAIGRCIRHKNDYGAIFLIDQRYPNFISKFPRWVQSSIVPHVGISDIKTKLPNFYREMDIRFPKRIFFTKGVRYTFSCIKCKEKVLDIPEIEITDAHQIEKAGFLRLMEAENDINGLFLSRNSKKKMFLTPSLEENVWSEEDSTVYNPIFCKCGVCLGAHIVAATSDDSVSMDGDLFLLSRLNAIQEIEKIVPQKPKTTNRKRKQKKEEKGQLKLKF